MVEFCLRCVKSLKKYIYIYMQKYTYVYVRSILAVVSLVLVKNPLYTHSHGSCAVSIHGKSCV